MVLGGYVLSYTVLKPKRLISSRAPTSAFCGYSASAPTMATVCGLGVCLAASSKKPCGVLISGSGPLGEIWK